jgi:hypothetical protein
MVQLMSIHIVKGVQKGSMKQSMILYWGGEAYLGFYVKECPMFQKIWGWANQIAPFGKKNNYGCNTPSLINPSMNKYTHS